MPLSKEGPGGMADAVEVVVSGADGSRPAPLVRNGVLDLLRGRAVGDAAVAEFAARAVEGVCGAAASAVEACRVHCGIAASGGMQLLIGMLEPHGGLPRVVEAVLAAGTAGCATPECAECFMAAGGPAAIAGALRRNAVAPGGGDGEVVRVACMFLHTLMTRAPATDKRYGAWDVCAGGVVAHVRVGIAPVCAVVNHISCAPCSYFTAGGGRH